MKEKEIEQNIKEIYKQIKVDEQQVIILKKKLKSEKAKTFKATFQKYATAAILFITFTVGSVAVAAVTQHWNDYMKNNYHVTEKDISKYQDQGLLTCPKGEKTTCTKNGVKVTVMQTVVDSYHAFVSLKITGYKLKKKESIPEFRVFDAVIDGKKLSGWSDFYDGTVTGENMQPVLPNGKSLSKNSAGLLIFPYTQNDGSLEYDMLFTSNGKKDYFINKTIDITLSDLGQYINTTDNHMKNVISATWKIKAPLAGNQSNYKFTSENNVLGKTGITINKIQLSPLSVNLTLKSKKKLSQNMIPPFEGIKMKNGTIYLAGINYNTSNVTKADDKTGSTWNLLANVEGIIDINEVEGLLFENPAPYVGITKDEEIEFDGNKHDYYEIKIKPE